MRYEVGLTNQYIVSKSQRVDEVQIVTFNLDNVARHGRLCHFGDFNTFLILQWGSGRDALVAIGYQRNKTLHGTVLRNGDTNLAGNTSANYLNIGDGDAIGNDDFTNLIKVATNEAQLTTTHDRRRTIYVQCYSAFVLVSVQIVVAARCQR